MIEALRSGHIHHAGLDVFALEPLPAGHILTTLENVTLSAHSAFRTPEASANLIGTALEYCRRMAAAHRYSTSGKDAQGCASAWIFISALAADGTIIDYPHSISIGPRLDEASRSKKQRIKNKCSRLVEQCREG